MTIQLTYPDKSVVLLTSIYRSNGPIPTVTPHQQLERFTLKFDELLSSLQQTRKKSLIFTDSNIDLLDLRTGDTKNYLNLIFGKGYIQTIFKATRIQNNSKSLIDHILSNTKQNEIISGTLVSDVSDHFFSFIAAPNRQKNLQSHRTTLNRDFSQHNLNKFKQDIGAADWTNVLLGTNVDLSYSSFWTIYTDLYSVNFPLKRQRSNKNIHKTQNFMTQGILKSRETKNRLHKTAIMTPTDENILKYKTYKTAYQKIIRGAKKLYFTSKLTENASNPKKTWETLNEILGKAKKSKEVDQININGVSEKDPKLIANHFNSFFTKVGQEISDTVPPVAKQPEEYINYLTPVPDLQLGNTTPEHVLKIIKKFQPKYSCDSQGVSTKMVKFIGAEIAIPLSHIFNLSLQSGQFPSALKQCRVIPIFKSGNKLECDNYRPISLLSSISKVLEKIVAEKLVQHLLFNDLLCHHQYGFLPNRSTEHNLMQIVNFVSKALNEGQYCIGVFLDLRKAFDVCSHDILLKKLKRMGIKGIAHTWFMNYLSGRSQKVDINGNMSDALDLAISVLQGSILGPILFLCYINDFYMCTTLFSLLFADDTTCLAKGKKLSELTNYVNIELQKIANWFRANKMAVNTSKTKFIVFRTHGKPINPDDCMISFNSNELGQIIDPSLINPIDRIHNNGPEKTFKLLGVLFDEYLTFDEHINHLCSKISKSLFCINRIRNFITLDALKMLYFAMIHSHLMYCINIYSCANSTALNRLKIKQKEAIRAICNAGYREHTKPLFSKLKILPLDQMIKFSTLKFMYNFVNKKLPFSFNETWLSNRANNPSRELRNADDLYIPPHNLISVRRFPLFTFPRVWNEEEERKNSPTQIIYFKLLKSALLLEQQL